MRVAQFIDPILGIQRMHLERGDVDQKARPDELIVHPMIAQHVTDILTEKTFDAFSKLLHAIDIRLLHAPGAVRRIWWTRLKGFDSLFNMKVPGNIGD